MVPTCFNFSTDPNIFIKKLHNPVNSLATAEALVFFPWSTRIWDHIVYYICICKYVYIDIHMGNPSLERPNPKSGHIMAHLDCGRSSNTKQISNAYSSWFQEGLRTLKHNSTTTHLKKKSLRNYIPIPYITIINYH